MMAGNWFSTARKKGIFYVSHVFRLFLIRKSLPGGRSGFPSVPDAQDNLQDTHRSTRRLSC